MVKRFYFFYDKNFIEKKKIESHYHYHEKLVVNRHYK